jgi:hypothetical protein
MAIPLIGAIVTAVSEGFQSWSSDRKEIKKAKLAVKLAKLGSEEARWQTQAKAESDWDLEALRQSQYSWKDEWLLFILSLPFVGSFVPKIQDYVVIGWEYVSKAPMWYQICFIGVVAASFGLRWLVDKYQKKMVGSITGD